MQRLTTGLALGFAFGILLSGLAYALDSGETPVIRLLLVGVLLLGIVLEILRVRRVESREESRGGSPSGTDEHSSL
ncbi:hypothetical protein [Brachybacterium tyrofermentans]|uniref:hypothetical protein n=1 Tax=Brachybacterium tyrofermentans TaxID=47848 RepID=UPI000A1A4C58|nr:hypothetical protein FM103_04560 [Corynebacterium xerosis]